VPICDLSVVFLLSLCGALSDLSVNFPRFLTEQVASCSQKKKYAKWACSSFYVLGTPPSGRSPKAREDKTSGAMKPMSRASAEMARHVGPRVGRRRQAKTGRHKRPDEEWFVGPHGLRRSGRRGPPRVVGPSELYHT